MKRIWPRSSTGKALLFLALFLVVSFAVNYSYLLDNQSNAAESSAMEMQPPAVETVLLEQVWLRTWDSFSGRLSAVEQAEVRPLVGGTITEVLVKEGAKVEQGQLLFVIDPRPFEAALLKANASLATAESDLELAKAEYERAERLAKRNVVSQSMRDNSFNDLNNALALVDAARAQILEAELDLEYAYIRAPISGQIGRAEITVGNVIEAGGNAPVLTTIVNQEQLYAEFDVDEQTYFRVTVRDSQVGPGEGADEASQPSRPVPINVSVGGGDTLSLNAELHAFDNQFDSRTGTIRARAVVDNSAGFLVPGVFVNVELGSAEETPTLLLPDRALNVSQDKRFVYVVGKDDVVEYRDVTLGRAIGNRRVVLDGVRHGERVVVSGVQRLMPGMAVSLANN